MRMNILNFKYGRLDRFFTYMFIANMVVYDLIILFYQAEEHLDA